MILSLLLALIPNYGMPQLIVQEPNVNEVYAAYDSTFLKYNAPVVAINPYCDGPPLIALPQPPCLYYDPICVNAVYAQYKATVDAIYAQACKDWDRADAAYDYCSQEAAKKVKGCDTPQCKRDYDNDISTCLHYQWEALDKIRQTIKSGVDAATKKLINDLLNCCRDQPDTNIGPSPSQVKAPL